MAKKAKKNNLEAIQAYIEPYELSEGKLELLLSEQGLLPEDEYDPIEGRQTMVLAVIEALYSVITLIEESDNGSKQRYDIANIEKLIRHYKGEDSDGKKMVRDATREGIW